MSNEINVIVVPETDDFEYHVSHGNVVWINGSLGTPQLEARNVKYLVPYWLKETRATRIFQITDVGIEEGNTAIYLGHSFVLPKSWNKMGSHRKFEYFPLKEFGMTEISEGYLMRIIQ